MYNSILFEDITDYSDYLLNPLILAVSEQYKELFSFVDAVWKDAQSKGTAFEEHFRPFFPPGYIDRDIIRAREVINSLFRASESYEIRLELPPICCFVLYELIYKYGPYVRMPKAILQNEELKKYMAKMPNESETKTSRASVRRWFKETDEWLTDIELTYDSDCVNIEQIERYGELYLRDDVESRIKFENLKPDIEALSDLMPFDLRERVTQKIEAEKKLLPAAQETVMGVILSACEKISANPIDTKDLDEDALNRRVRDLIEIALERDGFVIQDQTQRGYGKAKNKPGELDILIKKKGLSIAIIEGLLRQGKRSLYEHIEKVLQRYNYSGCRMIYIIDYVRESSYDRTWKDIIKDLEAYPGLIGQPEDTTLDEVRLYEGQMDNTKTIRVLAAHVE